MSETAAASCHADARANGGSAAGWRVLTEVRIEPHPGAPSPENPAPPVFPGGRGRLSDAFLKGIARRYVELGVEAADGGRGAVSALADEMGVKRATAAGWIHTARKRGLLAPSDRPGASTAEPAPTPAVALPGDWEYRGLAGGERLERLAALHADDCAPVDADWHTLRNDREGLEADVLLARTGNAAQRPWAVVVRSTRRPMSSREIGDLPLETLSIGVTKNKRATDAPRPVPGGDGYSRKAPLTDAFLKRISARYVDLYRQGVRALATLAGEEGVACSTAAGWVRTARRRGLLLPLPRGGRR